MMELYSFRKNLSSAYYILYVAIDAWKMTSRQNITVFAELATKLTLLCLLSARCSVVAYVKSKFSLTEQVIKGVTLLVRLPDQASSVSICDRLFAWVCGL